MNAIESVFERMMSRPAEPAIIWRDKETSYGEFGRLVRMCENDLEQAGIGAGTVCAVVGDYSPITTAFLFALMRRQSITVPMLRESVKSMALSLDIASVEYVIAINDQDEWQIKERTAVGTNALVQRFRTKRAPGLIVFTSGSTGEPKGILHDAERVMRKFVAPRRGWRTILFLMLDHFGGFNSLLSTFAYGGTGICVDSRNPDVIATAIQRHRATLMPTTPTFLNLLIASGSHLRFDLSSIELITYGTEVMTEATLHRVRSAFPAADIKQTYGLSELGVLRSRSESKDSTWVQVGGDGFEVKVLEGVLWIRSEANMVGYLNATDPFDDDGWMCTGDRVEVRGDYYRILGRESDLIFVGGEKVFPAEVETVLQEDPNVQEATVFGVRHQVMGQVAHARLSLREPEDPSELTARLRRLCLSKLARFKVPLRFEVVSPDQLHSSRFKKVRGDGEGI